MAPSGLPVGAASFLLRAIRAFSRPSGPSARLLHSRAAGGSGPVLIRIRSVSNSGAAAAVPPTSPDANSRRKLRSHPRTETPPPPPPVGAMGEVFFDPDDDATEALNKVDLLETHMDYLDDANAAWISLAESPISDDSIYDSGEGSAFGDESGPADCDEDVDGEHHDSLMLADIQRTASQARPQSLESEFFIRVAQGDIQMANSLLNDLRRDGSELRSDLYNALFLAQLKTGKLRMARRTFKMILSDQRANYVSYVLMIICHGMEMKRASSNALAEGKQPLDDVSLTRFQEQKRRQVRAIVRRMRQDGHDLAELHRRVLLPNELVDTLVETVRIVWPDFEEPSPVYLIRPGQWRLIGENGGTDVCEPTFSASSAWSMAAQEQYRRETSTLVGIPIIHTQSAKAALKKVNTPGSKQRKQKGGAQRKKNGAGMASVEPGVGLQDAVQRVQQMIARERAKWEMQRTPYKKEAVMYSLSDEDLASIVLAEMDVQILHESGAVGVPLQRLCREVGRQVFVRHFIQSGLDNGAPPEMLELYPTYERKLHASNVSIPRELWEQQLEEKDIIESCRSLSEAQWSNKTMMVVGSALVDMVIRSVRLQDLGDRGMNHRTGSSAEAFYHTYDYRDHKIVGMIKPHPDLESGGRKKQKAMVLRQYKTYRALELPMVSVPKPWRSIETSPYLAIPASLVRCGLDQYQHLALLSKMQNSIGDVYDALNYLSTCPWRINTAILDHMIPIYEEEQGHADLAVPPLTIDVPRASAAEKSRMSPEKRREFENNVKATKKLFNENLGLRADFSNKLYIANAFKNDTFYLPHNMDFRGRTYTVPPHLSHFGSDLSRSLLRFAEAKPLGSRGLFWLKVHIANLSGVDKVSFEDRVDYTENHLPQILNAASDPFGPPLPGDSEKWWRQTDSPWQTLAACIELKAALDSGDPENFASSLPVHQDGTCNGLQHYAALGGDVTGAAAVNLCNVPGSERPQDVYMQVVNRVNELVTKHSQGDFSSSPHPGEKLSALKDHGIVQQLAADVLAHGPVARKTVKQTIMTSVYGVTFIGARDQIFKQLKAKEYEMSHSRMNLAAGYLACCTFQCLDEMFQQAHSIKKWLSDCAHTIAKSGKPVTWITPMNLPIIQPYHKERVIEYKASMQRLKAKTSYDINLPANAAKQKSAFPPNYVHSLDSTHMLATANACNAAGIRFVSVHDSYWTHAASIDEMNRHLREQFAWLHSQPLLSRLYEHFRLYHDRDQHLGKSTIVTIPEPPPQGDFQINDVLKSRYFFN